MVGDTGSAKQPHFQKKVSAEMTSQFVTDRPEEQPQFLFHLGDVVYHFGEAEEYYRQFFQPYKDYPAPIFAIAGNHDSDVNPHAAHPYKSLDAFVEVFCDSKSRDIKLAQDSGRKTNIQPNIYYTLQTPLADFICLYSNVPKFGIVEEEQKEWFVEELKASALNRSEKAIILCIHHAPFSADFNHGSSRPMIEFLEAAYNEAGVRPDIVFSGHVHNYQRFSKQYDDGTTLPYIVAGAGGYVTLFPLISGNATDYTADDALLENVHLDTYCDDKHGFLKVEIEKKTEGLELSLEYYTIPHVADFAKEKVSLFDRFSLWLKR